MSRLGRGLAALAGTVTVLLLGVVGPSYAAGGGLQQCLDQAVNHNGEPPTCTKENGVWVASWPDDSGLTGSSGGGIPGAFVAFAVFTLIVAVAITIWKVSTAQKLGRQSGMDPGLATQMTLLTDNGLDATYLASSLRQQQPAQPVSTQTAAGAPPPSATSRLEELKSLLDRGLVTQAEYDARRQAIIDSV